MSRIQANEGIKFWSKLRTRMALSYVGVTLVIVLLLEGLVLTVAFLVFTRSPFLGYLALERADHAAQIYALQAAVQADGASLNQNITFEPERKAALSPGSRTIPHSFHTCI